MNCNGEMPQEDLVIKFYELYYAVNKYMMLNERSSGTSLNFQRNYLSLCLFL